MNIRSKTATISLIAVSIAIILATLVNIIIGFLPKSILKIDLTSSGITDISDDAAELIKKIDRDVTLYYICAEGAEDEQIEVFSKKYAELNSKISIKQIDPITDPSFISGITNGEYTELEDNSFIAVNKTDTSRYKVVPASSLYSVNVYANNNGTLSLVYENMSLADFNSLYSAYYQYFEYQGWAYNIMFAGEGALTSAIDYALTDVLPVVYFLSGHGESEMSPKVTEALKLDNIKYSSLSLLSAGGVPEDASLIIINAPSSDISDTEAAFLSSYLEKGGDLLLLSYFSYTGLERLESLLASYGLICEEGYLSETNSNYYAYYPYCLLPETVGAESILDLNNLDATLFLAHSIKETECDRTVEFIPLFTTSDKCMRVVETKDPKTTAEDDSNNSSYDATEGKYHAGAWVIASGEESITNIVWIGTPYFLNESYDITGNNLTYFVSMAEKICEKKSSVSISTKFLSGASVVTTTDAEALFWTIVFCAIIPALMIALGSAIVIKRRRR